MCRVGPVAPFCGHQWGSRMTANGTHLQASTEWPNPVCDDCDRAVLVTMRGQCLLCQPGGVPVAQTIGPRRRTLTSHEAGVR